MEQLTQNSSDAYQRPLNGRNRESALTETIIRFERHPAERPLFALTVIISLAIYLACILSIVAAIYGVLIALFIFFAHVAFVAYLRGNAVQINEQQFPALHARFTELAQRMGLRRVPELYLTHADGALNALATRFRGANMVVLYSELIEACGDDEQARDFIIAHELAHLKANHLRWFWLTQPASFIPFLGHAYSRACEYTADRWGYAVSGGGRRSIHGLTVLAVGGSLAKEVNLTAFLEQRQQLRGGLMTIGRWLSTHPPLVDRIAALSAGVKPVPGTAGVLKALLLLLIVTVLPTALVGIGIAALAKTTSTSGSEEAYNADSAEIGYADLAGDEASAAAGAEALDEYPEAAQEELK